MNPVKDVVIIGAGPAGIATAIHLKRCNIDPVVLEQNEVGGLLRNANWVENYPGFPKGISGLHLRKLFKKQLENIRIKVNFEKVQKLDFHPYHSSLSRRKCKEELFFTKTNRRVIVSNFAVIASGTKPKKIQDLHISNNIKDRIFHEIYPIRNIRNNKIAIIGAGDAAFDYALTLSKRNEVLILNRRKQAKCIPLLIDRCQKSKSIFYLKNVSIKEIKKGGKKLVLTCVSPPPHLLHQWGGNKRRKISLKDKVFQIYADYVVIAIGREPCLDFIGKSVENNFNNLMKKHRLYLVGDVKNEIYRQTAICVGDGVKAAMKIYQTIKKGKNEDNR
jgi:thioredoxin reductase